MRAGEVGLDFVLFNVYKQLYSTSREVNNCKNKWLRNGTVEDVGQDKIELSLDKIKDKSEGLKDFYYNFSNYPFLYYREIIDIKSGSPKYYQLITMVRDLKQVKEIILKDIEEQGISVFQSLVLYYTELLPCKIVTYNEEGYKETHSLTIFGVQIPHKDLKIMLEFDIYEVEQEGQNIEYFYTSIDTEKHINSLPDGSKVKVLKNGKEIEQGIMCFDAITKENWLYKGEELDPNRIIYENIKLLEK